MKNYYENKTLNFFKNHPEISIFKEVESLLSNDLKPLIEDMSFKKGILWIKVKHPSASLLLLMQKMAIMSKLKRLSTSFCIRDLKVVIASDNSLELPKENENISFPVDIAPTGVVQGEREPITNPRTKELMEALRHKIQGRKD